MQPTTTKTLMMLRKLRAKDQVGGMESSRRATGTAKRIEWSLKNRSPLEIHNTGRERRQNGRLANNIQICNLKFASVMLHIVINFNSIPCCKYSTYVSLSQQLLGLPLLPSIMIHGANPQTTFTYKYTAQRTNSEFYKYNTTPIQDRAI